MAVYKNLSSKELYASIPDTTYISEMFKEGLKLGSTQLAVSAMEELILRGDTDLVAYGLDYGCKNGYIKLGTSMSTMIARSLIESCRAVDPFLTKYGKALFKGEGETGPFDWAKQPDTSSLPKGDIPEIIMG